MFDKILIWFRKNEIQCVWFIIGFLSMALLEALARGDYITATINAALIVINFHLRPRAA